VDSIDPEAQRGDEADGRKEVSGELVVARGDTTKVLEAAEGALMMFRSL
jgi:hypothetical protein